MLGRYDTSNGSDALGNVSGMPNISSRSNVFLPINIQDRLHAYTHWQSQVYGDLIASFVSHWRTYLLAHSLSAAWLGNYLPPVILTPM